MPKHRTLRQKLLLSDDEDDEDDEDFISEEEEKETPSTKSKLPLPASIKLKTLEALDSEGGIQAVTRASGVLKSVCDSNSVDFGGPQGKTPRNRRRQVSNFVDKFKRRNLTPQSVKAARVKLQAEAAAEAVTVAANKQKKKKTKVAKKQPSPPSPPEIKKIANFPTMSDILGSPLRLIRGSGKKKRHEEKYDADIDNEEQHGEYLVTLCSDEQLGKKQASCIVIARPNTNPSDIKHLKAKFTADAVTITGPAKSTPFLDHSDKWLGVMEQNKDKFKSKKLKTTMLALVTKLKKKQKLKETIISFKNSGGIVLSNEYFNNGAPEGELSMLPLPYTYEVELGNKKGEITAAMVIWRAYIDDSIETIEEEDADETDDYASFLKMVKEPPAVEQSNNSTGNDYFESPEFYEELEKSLQSARTRKAMEVLQEMREENLDKGEDTSVVTPEGNSKLQRIQTDLHHQQLLGQLEWL